MRILVDGQALQTDSRIQGIGRYTTGLIGGLCDNGAEVVVLLNGAYEPRCSEAIEELSRTSPKAKVEVFHAISDGDSKNEDELDNYLSTNLYQEAVNCINPDVFLCPSFFEPHKQFICPPIERLAKQYPVVAVEYDLIPLLDADNYLTTSEYRKRYFSQLRAIFSTDFVFCISKFSEQQLHKVCPGIKTEVIFGASFSENLKQVQKKKYLFYCGGFDARNNVDFLCRAYAKLPDTIRNEHPLYLCIREKDPAKKALTELISGLRMNHNIQFVKADNNKQLARFYAECHLFIFPSKSEGLGLPLIEALTNRAPVLTSNSTSLPEIIDNPEAWFSSCDEAQLTEKLHQALTDGSMLQRLQDYSDQNQNKFTWKKVGQHAMATLFRLIGTKLKGENIVDTDLSSMVLSKSLLDKYKLSRIRQSKRTIYFDVSEYCQTKAHTGIQRVVNKFIQYLPEKISRHNFDIVYVTGMKDSYRIVEYRDGSWVALNKVCPVANDWYLSVDLCSGPILNNQTEIVEWKRRGVKLFIYIYDIIFSDHPEFIANESAVKSLLNWLNFSVKHADCIMSDSWAVVENIKRWAGERNIDISKTIFIAQHLGSDFNIESFSNCAKKTGTYQFICVSTIEPRKGYIPLLKAFIKALDEGMDARLVVVGRYGWDADAEVEILRNNPYAGTKIVWESNCSDQRLGEMYRNSDCFVFASYDEGFGLGIVEAAQFGLPLLLRDIPVFREVAGNHALYFTDVNLSDCLKSISSNKMKLPSVKGMEILTWEQSVHRSAAQLIAMAEKDLFSYLKGVETKHSLGTILEAESQKERFEIVNNEKKLRRCSMFNRIKYKVLARIWFSSKGRRHYRDKYNATRFRG